MEKAGASSERGLPSAASSVRGGGKGLARILLVTVAAVLVLIAVWETVGSSTSAHRQQPRPGFDNHHPKDGNDNDNDNTAVCGLDEPAPRVKAPRRNVWAGISAADNKAVWDLLHDPASGLNLTHPDVARINDNYVFWIDRVPANKSAVLPYLHSGGGGSSSKTPDAYARVIIFEGGKPEPVSQEYQVGPLPVSPATRIERLDYMYNGGAGGTVPFNGRNFDEKRMLAVEPLVRTVMISVADITAALFDGAAYYGVEDPRTNIIPLPTTPSSLDGDQAFVNMVFTVPGQAMFLSNIDMYIMVDCPGTDTSHYKLRGLVTHERFFADAASLRAAFAAGELAPRLVPDRDPGWAEVNHRPELGVRDPLERRLAPQTVELGGKRYRVDAEEQYVEYMGWSFYVAHSRSLGIMFFDVRFRGERVLYELSLQEAMAQYAGFQPKSTSTAYHDTYYGLGVEMGVLVEGFDCPFGATFWNISYHERNHTRTTPRAICIFEADPGHPLSRHRTRNLFPAFGTPGFANLGTVKAAVLTVRAIATVGNYDYLFDYGFGLDGALEVTVRASGYLMSSYHYGSQEGRFGPRIQRATQGSLHDHVLTWKADFDLLDERNSLEVTRLVAVNQTQPWFPELGAFEQIETRTTTLPTEQTLNWSDNDGNMQTMYTVVHANATNQWGEKRGYRIVPGRSDVRLSTTRSPFTLRNSEFAKSHLAVTRQHDTEPFANSVQNMNLPWRPQQDFSRFFDGEGLEGEDLVVWFNLGMHHFTRAEDVPVTLFGEAVSSVTFAPQNFFDRAQDGDLLNRRWVVADRDTGAVDYYDTYGVPLPQCRLALKEPVESLIRAQQEAGDD